MTKSRVNSKSKQIRRIFGELFQVGALGLTLGGVILIVAMKAQAIDFAGVTENIRHIARHSNHGVSSGGGASR